MAQPRSLDAVLLVVAAFSRHEEALGWARQQLEHLYGPIARASPPFDFHHTSYYEATMGPGLRKQLLCFVSLVAPDCLAAVKTRTNDVAMDLRRLSRARRT
jgi:hypothetical protein